MTSAAAAAGAGATDPAPAVAVGAAASFPDLSEEAKDSTVNIATFPERAVLLVWPLSLLGEEMSYSKKERGPPEGMYPAPIFGFKSDIVSGGLKVEHLVPRAR